MDYQVNEHVSRLGQYLPFQPTFTQLYAEYVDTRQSLLLATKAFDFVAGTIARAPTRLVVLTGDPGHGKTHLCGQLIKSVSPEVEDVPKALKERGDGSTPLAEARPGVRLHVIKDLSELPLATAVERLATSLSAEDRVTVVCANEGRLRHVVSADRTRLGKILAALEHVLQTGRTTPDGIVHVVNMNHQSVAAPGGKSLVLQALRSWVEDRRKWVRCGTCAAKDSCPIFENHRLLGADDQLGRSRRQGIEDFLRVAEKTDHVITIRELLVFLAYTITGGLGCRAVHDMVHHRRSNQQWRHMFFQAAFAQDLREDEVQRFSVFRAARLLDPGRRAIRPVDDRLDAEANDVQGRFLPPSTEREGAPLGRSEQRAVARRRQEIYAFLRRRDFFAQAGNPETAAPPSERLGVEHYGAFERLLQQEIEERDKVDVRNTVLCGLEAIQGVRRPPNAGSFAVVDPAFSSHRGNASVVALQIQKKTIRLCSQTEWWKAISGEEPDIANAVDWIDRKVHVVIPDTSGKPHGIDLDCRQFELVCRAARGLVSRAFFQADIRRITAQLAAICANAPRQNEITVIVGGKTARLVIDVGNRILASHV